MPLHIEQEQQATVSHRMSFWGQPSGGGASWDYDRGVSWLIKRPADGRPALIRSIQCRHCRRLLRYRVHSIEASHERQRMWRIFAYGGLALFVAGFAGLFVMFGNADNVVLVVAVLTAFFGGGALGGFCAMAAAEEAGITGHFAWYPGPTKHKVEIHRPQEQVQLNAFVCGRCGHRERFWVASARSEAEQRMREHACL